MVQIKEDDDDINPEEVPVKPTVEKEVTLSFSTSTVKYVQINPIEMYMPAKSKTKLLTDEEKERKLQ
mgnify:CR=1 FL=1